MPTAAGRIDHGQVQQRLLRVGAVDRLGDQRVQCLVQHQRDQRRRGVVGTGGLAVGAGGGFQREGAVVGVVARRVGQQALVHAAEFLAVEVAVVDAPGRSGDRVIDLRQCFHRGQQVAVGQHRTVEHGQRVAAEHARAQSGQAELWQAVTGQGVGDNPVGLPQVGVPATDRLGRQPAQPGGGEIVGVEPAGRR